MLTQDKVKVNEIPTVKADDRNSSDSLNLGALGDQLQTSVATVGKQIQSSVSALGTPRRLGWIAAGAGAVVGLWLWQRYSDRL